MPKIPFPKIQHPTDPVANRVQKNVEDAFNRLGSTTLDHWQDGTTYRKVLGVNSANLLTASGIAPYTIQASNIASGVLTPVIASGTLQGSALVAGAIGFDRLTTAGQFSVYRTAAFTCGPNARSPLIADHVLKDVAGGYNTANGIYTLPAAGDWLFSWAIGFNTMVSTTKQMFSALVINSGEIFGGVQFSSSTNQYQASEGSYLYCNGLAGDKVTLRVFNGDTVSCNLAVGSGQNFLTGYQVR